MPAVKITQKPIGIPGDDTHFLVTQPEFPEGYTPTGQETEEELAELKVESVREIEMDDMVELIQDKLDMDVTPTTGSSKLVTSGGIKAALDLMDEDISSLNEDITNLSTATSSDIGKALSPKTVTNGKVTEWQYKSVSGGGGGGGTSDYTDLDNKPSIEGVTLAGSMTLSDIGAASASDLTQLGSTVDGISTTLATKAAASDLTAETTRATNAEATKIDKPSTDGTAGQVLQTDGNGGVSWRDVTGPSDAQVSEAVSDWLDEHPEATTTVADGSITKAKLAANALEDVESEISYIGIKDVYSGQTSVSGLPTANKTVTLTSDLFNEKFYTESLNALPVRDSAATTGGITWTPVGNHYELSGTFTSGYFMFDWENIVLDSDIVQPGDTVFFCIKSDISFKIWVRDNTGNLIQSTVYDSTTNMVKVSITLPSNFTKMRISVFGNSDTSYAGSGKVWFGVYKSDAVFTSCGSSFTSNSATLDTLYNTMSLEAYKNTKEYVDSADTALGTRITTLSDKVDDGITFLTPEMYGAAGDGTTDDTTAFQACITAAIPSRIPIRAERRYKTTSTLSIVGDYLDVKINELIYTGTSAAIEFTCNFSKIEIGRILATSTNAVGIVFTDRASGSPDRCQSNYCIIGTLWTNGNCMEFLFPNGKFAYYNEIHLRRCLSSAANIIYVGHPSANALSECDFYGAKYLSCQNGYVMYIKDCGLTYARLHEFTMEADCRNGIYGVACLINCRTAEMLDRWTSADPRGYLFTVKDIPWGLFAENTRCDYLGIEMTNAKSWDDILLEAREKVDAGATYLNLYYHFGTNFDEFHLSFCNRIGTGGHYENNTQRLIPQGKLKIVYDKVIFIPNKRSVKAVSTATFAAYDTDYTFPTDFVAEADCTIELNDSYCCVGINDITIEQKSSHKATILDKNGATIFDGTNLADGVYRLTCSLVPIGALTISGLETSNSVTMEAYSTANIYTGLNEKWIIA